MIMTYLFTRRKRNIELIPNPNRENVKKAASNSRHKRVLSCFRFQLDVKGESFSFLRIFGEDRQIEPLRSDGKWGNAREPHRGASIMDSFINKFKVY